MQVENNNGLPADVYGSFASTLASLQTGQVDIIEAAELWSQSTSPLESQVWQLVALFYASRLRTLDTLPSSLKYHTPAALVGAHLNAKQALGDLAVIKDWLCSSAHEPLPADIRRGYAPYSKHNNNAVLRSAGGSAKKGASLDPDAPLRSGSHTCVAPEDEAYEQSLLRSLYELVRVGDLEKAVDLCREADMDWRAASLNGAAVWSHTTLDDLNQEGHQMAAGNLNRRLWKSSASKLANTPSPAVKAYERALYGALAGDLNSVLPVCESWEDHLWAHINALFESRIDNILALPNAPSTYFSHDPSFSSSSATVATNNKDLAGVFDGLLQRAGRVGIEARHPLRMAVACMAQDQLSRLFSEFVSQMERSAGDLDPQNQADLIRFFAHLVLFFRGLDDGQQSSLPLDACTKIIDAYVQVLQLNDKPDLVALYASQLQADNAIEAYAQFLATISPTSSQEERRLALLRTRDHELDFASVAIRTAQLIIESSLSPPELDRELLFRPDAPQSDVVESLVRSIEWLMFDRATYVEALLQANALIRWFMICGLTAAAQRLLASLPADLEQAIAGTLESEDVMSQSSLASRLTSALRELEQFKAFFGCLDAYEACRSWVPPTAASKLDQRPAVEHLQLLTEQFYVAALGIFTEEWLESDNDGDLFSSESEQQRLLELAKLRKTYIPELVIRLHHILFESRTYIPENLQKAIELSNVVADEVSHVYLAFSSAEGGNRMGEYLQLVREACIAALGTSPNPFVVGKAP